MAKTTGSSAAPGRFVAGKMPVAVPV